MIITTVWRVRGEGFDVDAFLGDHPEITPSLVWRRGTRVSRRKRLEADSGSNVPLCERESLDETMDVIRRWLVRYRRMLKGLHRRGAESVLDFGVYVGSREQFAPRLEFAPDDMAVLAGAGVGIAISAYPVASERAVRAR